MSGTQMVLKEIKKYRKTISTQQMRTLRGQVLAGDIAGAMRGLDKLIGRAATGGDS